MTLDSAAHNEVPLSRSHLLKLLDDLQARILSEFRTKVTLFVHGGAVMILHRSLSSSSTRRTTRDIDYIARALGHEWRKRGVHDAEARLRRCIAATAACFKVGSDWMNADADVALPFARDPRGHTYDPIYHDAKQPNNITLNTIYDSPGLQLVSVTMFWGVALKLVRYQKDDPADIAAMLRHGTRLNGVQWTPQVMEEWIRRLCWPMGYAHYGPAQQGEMRGRISDAVARARKHEEPRHHSLPPPLSKGSHDRLSRSSSSSSSSSSSARRPYPPVPAPSKVVHAPVPSWHQPIPTLVPHDRMHPRPPIHHHHPLARAF